MLELSAELSPTAGTLHQAKEAARQLWANLHYETFEATSWNIGPEVATLRFVTAVPGVGLCVTGRLLIGGEHYARLVRKGR